jgi:hypothetical protein
MKNLPIGTQSFEVLRSSGFVYVDKTEHILNLINSGRVYFLSRPRRFGKSLLVSTLSELFAGKKDLFKDLYIYDKWDWDKTYPIVHLDFSKITYGTVKGLKNSLSDFINRTAIQYEVNLISSEIETRFSELIETLRKKAGDRVAILIDEYDKPMIDNIGREVYPEVKRTLHDFYQVIKASDEHLKFVLLTGVSRFSGLSIFSGLNNLNDITMNYKYATICGYTQEELESNFKEYIEDTGKHLRTSYEETLGTIKRWYNGYSWDGKTFVYNPFSTLMFFENKKFKDYWYKTATPTFLIEQIVKKNGLDRLIGQGTVIISSLPDVDYDRTSSIDLLFQTGYLTIKKEELRKDKPPQYTLDFPNMEVEEAFLSGLLAVYANRETDEIDALSRRLKKALKERDSEGLQKSLTELYANVPYDLHVGKEKYYHSLFLVAARLSGFKVHGEEHTDKGRIDVVLKRGDSVIVVEIKYGDKKLRKLLDEAMRQIREKTYYEKYSSSDVALLAVAFGKGKEIGSKFEEV